MRFRPLNSAIPLVVPLVAPLVAALLLPQGALAQAPARPPATTGQMPAAAGQMPAAAGQMEDAIVARVDGQPVRLSDVLATAQEVLPPDMRNMPPAMLLQAIPVDARRQLIERTITERALTSAARALGIDKDEVVRRRIQRAEEQELQQAYLTHEVAGQVTEAALRARYDQESSKRQGEDEIHARHILVRTEPEAIAAIGAVKGGEEFGAVAKRLSIDPGAKDGGDLGFFKRGDMVPEFAEAAFAMQPGEISAAPVKSPFGWHVIKVEERRSAAAPPFEEARQELRQQMLQEHVEAVVQRVRASAKIERVDAPQAGPSLLDGAAPPTAPGGRPAPQRRP